MKGMIQDAPEQVRMANAIGAQAQQLAAAQQAAAHAQSAAVLAAAPAVTPADTSRSRSVNRAVRGYLQRPCRPSATTSPRGRRSQRSTASRPDRWGDRRFAGWNDRIRTSPDRCEPASTRCTSGAREGVFKSMRDLQKVTKEMDRTGPRRKHARMAGIQDMMTQATNAANTATSGVSTPRRRRRGPPKPCVINMASKPRRYWAKRSRATMRATIA